ncbi:MAG TPA: HEAT repeat domain-containing protein [Planctomycetota bacterium]
MNRETALRDLSHGQPDVRRRAARVLGRWSDDQVLSALTGALQSPDRGIREAATDTLLEIGDARTVRLLLPLLRSSAPATRNSARLLLQRLSKAAPELLVELSRDPDVRMRVFAANIMAESGDHDLSGPLLELLEDPDENVRDAAVVGLGRLGAPEAVRRLETFATEGASWIRFSAIDALSQIGSAEATRALIRLLDQASPELQEPVIDALGRQGSPEAIVPLLQKLNAAASLGPAIAAVLVDSLASDVPSRAKDVDRASLARALSRALEDGSFGPERAVAALDLLAELGVPDEGGGVTRQLTSPDPTVQGAAIRAALTLRLTDAVPVLRELQNVCDPTLAKEIHAVLASLGAPRKESL